MKMGAMKIGYARTSTVEQIAGLEAQEHELQVTGVEKVFSERVSSAAKREQLEAALDFCRQGDVLVVTKLDRLARSMTDLVGITSKLKAKGVELQVLAMDLDTSTPTGKLILNLMGSFAEFEREIMLERQREGVARAKLKASTVAGSRRHSARPLMWFNCGARGLSLRRLLRSSGSAGHQCSVF
jgi:DNA invertase Pin-like site-specific DNA recombinase